MHTMKAGPGGGAILAETESLTRPSGELVRVEEEVLRDFRHELGNYFHKLYYWADVVAGEEEAATRMELGERLADTIHRLEEYLKLAARYFEPEEAACIPMSAGELSQAVASLLRAESPEATVETAVAPGIESAAAMIDPNRFSAAFRIAAHQLNQSIGGAGWSTCACRMRSAGEAIEIEIEVPANGASIPTDELPVMEWALARKTIEMHGGSLSLGEPESGTRRCILVLPFAS